MAQEPLENSLYDDDEAVKYIQSHLPQELQGKYTDDDILLITDTVVEYYERNGWLEADADEEVEIDMDDIVAYVALQCKKDKECRFDTSAESLRWVIEAEMDYEESLG